MRFTQGSFLTALLGAAAVLSTAQAGVLYDSNGFESPTFTAGNLKGQNGWTTYVEGTTTEADIIVQTQNVYEGNQAIQIKNTGSRAIARRAQTVTQNHWIDLMLLTPTAAEVRNNASILLRGRNSTNNAGLYASISLNTGGAVNNVPTGDNNKYTLGAWNRFTIFLDIEKNTWDLYINGKLAGAGMSFNAVSGNSDVTSITQVDIDWTSKAGAVGSGVGVDNFQITDSNPIPEPAGAAMFSVLSSLLLARVR